MEKSVVVSIKTVAIFAIFAIFLSTFVGCSSSTLLIGEWGDPYYDIITMNTDGTFTASIPLSGNAQELTGSYDYDKENNLIVFRTEDKRTIVSRVSISGGVLEISWKADMDVDEVVLLLYKQGNAS